MSPETKPEKQEAEERPGPGDNRGNAYRLQAADKEVRTAMALLATAQERLQRALELARRAQTTPPTERN